MIQIQRYALVVTSSKPLKGDDIRAEAIATSHGEYVKHEDYQKLEDLFRTYVENVRECEGVDFIEDGYLTDDQIKAIKGLIE